MASLASMGARRALLLFLAKPKNVSAFPSHPHFRLSYTRHFRTCSALRDVVQFHLSDIGEGIKEVTVKEWFVRVGDRVAQFDQICEVQSDKASVTITSRFDGVIKKLHYAVDDIAQTGDPLVDIDVEGEAGNKVTDVVEEANDQAGAASSAASSPSLSSSKKTLATPAVRRVASQYNVDLADVEGSGKDGRVMKEDVLRYVEGGQQQQQQQKQPQRQQQQQQQQPATQPKKQELPPRPPPRSPMLKDTEKAFTPFTKAMTKSMTAALQIPHFGYKDEIDMSRLVEIRPRLKELAAAHGVKISYVPFMVKAASLALTRYPNLNAQIDLKAEKIVLKAAHNIGVAMDTPDGLIVPNIKNVQDMSVLEIAAELNRLSELGVKGKLGGSDLKEGTFTLSNIGSIGGTYAMPVIMPPEVAIGAVGKIQALPR